MTSHGKYEQGFRCRGLVQSSRDDLGSSGEAGFPVALYRDGPPAKTIQLLVHMLPGDQCTRFVISKMTTIKACPTFHAGRWTPYHLLATECNGGNFRFRLAYERGTVPHRSTNGRSPVCPPLDHGELQHD
jgi:hypothetical protein